MKIAYCITRMDEIGGAQIHLRDIAIAYKNQGHDISIISGSLGDLTDHLEGLGIKIFHVPSLKRSIHPYYDVVALFQIAKTLLKIKPDIVACHSSKAGLLGRLAAKICGFKSVFTAHGWAFTEGVPERTASIYRRLEKWAAKITTHIITVSEYDRNLALKYNVVPAEKMTVIHNGIPDVKNMPCLEKKKQSFKMIMIARFSEPKNHQLLLESLKNCLDVEWRLDFVGSGSTDRYIEYCKRHGMFERVRFLGERKDIPELLNEADACVLISSWEALPLSILEAMRASLPVIASDVGGIKECVIDGTTGYLVSKHDSTAVELNLRRLMKDRDMAVLMGKNGRKLYESSFSFERMIVKTMATYLQSKV